MWYPEYAWETVKKPPKILIHDSRNLGQNLKSAPSEHESIQFFITMNPTTRSKIPCYIKIQVFNSALSNSLHAFKNTGMCICLEKKKTHALHFTGQNLFNVWFLRYIDSWTHLLDLVSSFHARSESSRTARASSLLKSQDGRVITPFSIRSGSHCCFPFNTTAFCCWVKTIVSLKESLHRRFLWNVANGTETLCENFATKRGNLQR